jgi:NADH:ubiquinone oxidoreductase subunit K
MVALLLIAMRSASERVHAVVFTLFVIVIVAFTALYHLRLG